MQISGILNQTSFGKRKTPISLYYCKHYSTFSWNLKCYWNYLPWLCFFLKLLCLFGFCFYFFYCESSVLISFPVSIWKLQWLQASVILLTSIPWKKQHRTFSQALILKWRQLVSIRSCDICPLSSVRISKKKCHDWWHNTKWKIYKIATKRSNSCFKTGTETFCS